MYPDFSDLTCPLDALKPPFHELIRAGSPEQKWRFAFCRGAHDALRQAYRGVLPVVPTTDHQRGRAISA